MNPFLQLNPEVAAAMNNRQPVVALESTIIAHGMPYPQNVQTAREVEQVVRESGAVPATIAIMDGKCCVGLDAEQLEYLGKAEDVWKVSLRDMPYVVANKICGATTVAATMRIAAMAGINIFVTGGIGGVHRGAASTMDISADLTEMAHTSVAVVSAGIKSILDIGLTLEYLETQGVPVITLGEKILPGFYSRNSGFRSPLSAATAGEIAALLDAKWKMGLEGSVLIANPVPPEFEVPIDIIEQHIQNALAASVAAGVKGKELTPFLLQHIANHTKGESLEANIALIKHNAAAGAAIARAFAAITAA